MGEDAETIPGSSGKSFFARFLHFIHRCPIINLGLQLLPTQKQPHFSSQQLMSQGDGWSENTPSKAELSLPAQV